MAIKPSELEQKAADLQKGIFEKKVRELEIRIDEHIIFFADNVTQLVLIGYPVETRPAVYGGKIVPEAVVLEVIARYENAGWNVHRVEQSYNTILLFAPKDLQR